MKMLFHSRDRTSKGAALMIVLAFVVLLAGVALAYFSRTTTDRQLAQSSSTDTSAGLLARSALDIVVGTLKQEILNGGTTVTRSNIQPQRSGDDASIPNLIRRSVRNDAIPAPGVPSLASSISSGPVNPANPQRGEITSARWNSHYLVP
jgi:Tfp pilus assembly protein PilX